LIAVSLAITIGVSAGQWQLRRAAEKEAIENKLVKRTGEMPFNLDARTVDVDAVEYRHVKVSGEFVRDWAIYLENRPYHGVAGFYVLMPLKITGSNMHVLVARGWVPRNPSDRSKLPAIKTSNEVVTVEGMARRNPGHLMQLGQASAVKPNSILQNVTIAEVAAASNLQMQPVMIEQLNEMHDGLLRDWPHPSSGIDKHYGYAVQWFGLALVAFIFLMITGFRSDSRETN
jgi:surfeit locus 1 family protein